jgi:hypothetical protein
MDDTKIFRFRLGDKLKDRINGFNGVCTSRAQHLFGCARYWIEPQELKEGKPVDGRWYDEDSLEIVAAQVITARKYLVYEEDDVPTTTRVAERPVRRNGGPSDQPAAVTATPTR